MNSISIIGCGWFGLPLGVQLLNDGYHVKGSTTQKEKLNTINEKGIEAFQIQLANKIEGNLSFFHSDLIVVNVPPRKNTQESYFDSMNRLKNQVLLSKIKKVILISSTSVYPNTDNTVTEEDAADVKTPRSGISLLSIEKLWQNEQSIDLTILRFAGLYGPNRNPGRFLSGKHTKGAENPVNLVHLSDCIGAVQHVINQNLWGKVYNICAPVHPTRKLFYQAATKSMNIPAPIFESPQKGGFKIISSEKFVKEANYQYKFPDPIKSLETL